MTNTIILHANMDQYMRWLGKAQKQFPFAAAQALNDTAFDLKRDLEDRSTRDMRMNKRPRPALGIRIERANKKTLEATIGSPRGWLHHQVQKGTTKPIRGIQFEGKSYLLIPPPWERRKSGTLKRVRGTVFINRTKEGDLVMFVRTGRGRRQKIRTIGLLVPEAKYGDEFKWDKQVSETINKEFARSFERRLGRALATAR